MSYPLSIPESYDLLGVSDLNFRTICWRIRVKVLRRYTHSNGVRDPIDLILCDDKGNKIMATMSVRVERDFARLVGEGDWIILEKFDLNPAVGSFRPAAHAFRVDWKPETKFYRTAAESCSYYFSFVDFETILSGSCSPVFSVDLVGRVMSVGNFVSKENPFDSYLRGEVYLELEDLRGFRISCRLPRRYGQDFINGLSRCHANIIICVVQFARLEYFEGVWIATTAYDCTRVMLEPSIPEVVSMQEVFAAIDDGAA